MNRSVTHLDKSYRDMARIELLRLLHHYFRQVDSGRISLVRTLRHQFDQLPRTTANLQNVIIWMNIERLLRALVVAEVER